MLTSYMLSDCHSRVCNEIRGQGDTHTSPDNQNRNYVMSIYKALDVMLLFNQNERELSHATIAKRMGWTTSTTSRIVGTLLSRGFLSKSEDNGKYRLGYMINYLAAISRSNYDIHRISHPVLARINRITNETVHIFVRNGIYRICLDQVESKQDIKMVTDVGTPDYLWIGCTGRALLAFCPDEEFNYLINQIKTTNPDVDIDALQKKLKCVRLKGYSTKDGEWDRNCGCLAAPIYNADGVVEACLAISTPDFRFPEDYTEYAELIVNGAREISKELGYLG